MARMDFHFRRMERVRRWVAALFGLALLAPTLGAIGPSPAGSPFFEVRGGAPGVDSLPLKSTQVSAIIVGPIAEVIVQQTYANDGVAPLEARYVFPGSTRAAVHAMTMTVGARRIEAVIEEKNEARKTYAAAKAQGRTASLLEAQRSNVFEMNVANIQPGDVVTVELRYTELLTPTGGEYEWVFPTVVGPRYEREQKPKAGGQGTELEYPPQIERDEAAPVAANSVASEPVFTLSAEIVAGVPVRAVDCVSHRIETTAENGRTRVMLPPVSDAPQMNRDFILRYRLAGDAIESGLVIDEWRGEKFFLLTLQPPARVAPAQIPPRDYVFIVDISGSMHGFPLEVAKKLMGELLMALRENDTFNVLLFSGGSATLADAPVAATPENIAAALALIAWQSGGGGTELLPALRRALALPKRAGVARSVVVVTDGYVNVEAEAHALVRKNLGEANLFTFGIGSSVNRELIERLARAGRAEPTVIEGESRIVGEAEKFRAMIESPVLTRVRTELSGFGAHEVFPEVWPDVLAERPLTVVGKFSGPAVGAITLKGFSGAGGWKGEIDVTDAVNLGGRGVLAQLWARERLAELRDRHALGDEPAKRKDEIVQLGLKHNLLTPFTSFVAVDTVARLAPGAADKVQRVMQPIASPAGVTGGGELVPTTPEPATVSLIVTAALVAGWGVWRERRKNRRTRHE
jgi:Ca-activated chloride channel family protein